jgi:transketolase
MTERDSRPDLEKLRDLALQIRRDTIRMISDVGSGHPGGALGIADIMAALYGHVMHHNPKKPKDPDRDRLVLSNGHICAAYYSALSLFGYIPRAELATFRRINSRLQGHPARVKLPDLVETSSGPLGQGFSVANGIALANRLDKSSGRVYCIVGDGEMQEGQVWEALMTSAQHKIANLTLIVSYNRLQIDGEVAQIKNLMPLATRLESFGWKTIDADGHDMKSVVEALIAAEKTTDRPSAIIARTVMGKGAPFMEDKAMWHGTCPSKDQTEEALKILGKAKTYTDYTAGGAK